MSGNKELRPQLMELMESVDEDGSGSMDFMGLLRSCHNILISQRFKKEKKVVALTGFTSPEVHEFRQLFLHSDTDGDTELSLSEFKQMIANICPMGDRNAAALTVLFQEVSDQQMDVEGSRDELDFPEFMLLFKKMMDTNLGGIKERTEAFVIRHPKMETRVASHMS